MELVATQVRKLGPIIRRNFLDLCPNKPILLLCIKSICFREREGEHQGTHPHFERRITHAELRGGGEFLDWPNLRNMVGSLNM